MPQVINNALDSPCTPVVYDAVGNANASKSHLSDIECGRKAIGPDRAARFARALQLSEAQFVRLALQDIVDRAGLPFKVQTAAA
jgi:hypothetical protein